MKKIENQDERTTRIDFALWRKLGRYAWNHKRFVITLAVLAVSLAALEIALPLLTKSIVDAVAGGASRTELTVPFVMYGVLVVLLAACVLCFIRTAGRIKTAVSHDIRRDGFANLQRLSFSFYDKHSVGWLMARMTSDCERLANIMAWGVLDLIWGVTMMTGIAAVCLVINFKLGLIVLSFLPVVLVISKWFQKRILQSSRAVRKTNSKLTAAYNESIMGVRTSKAFTREEANLRNFRETSGEMYAASMRNALLSAAYLPLIISLSGLATGLALGAGGYDVSLGRISVGTLIAFMIFTRYFFDPIEEIARLFAEMQMAQASAERIVGLIETTPEVRDSDEVRKRLQVTPPTDAAPDGYPDSIGTIEFEGVSFRYDEEPVLSDFNLRVEPGQTIALVGSTGGGKSTIVSLLCRFYEPTHGTIRFEGIDYRDRSLAWLESKLGVVLQDPHLFSGTIADNIRYGKLEATSDEVERAARIVGASDFIDELADGYNTEVGEAGSLLSTGQKQLVSFARALLADPEILVMDEATSSIDTETERRIQKGIASSLAGRTSFVIAHRLSTIRSADCILVIERGRIVERGNHSELLALGGRYHELVRRQRLDPLEADWAHA